MKRLMVAALLLLAAAARADEPLAVQIVSGLSSGNLAVFAPLAEDPRQLRERDWYAVARAFDEHGCIDVRSFTAAAGPTTLRIDVDGPPGTPQTWIATIVETPNGRRIRALDDEATFAAKCICRTGTLACPPAPEDRQECLSYTKIAEALADLPLYTAEERRRGIAAMEALLDGANAVTTAHLLTAIGAAKHEDGDDAAAAKLAELALRIAPYDAPPRVFDAAHLLLGQSSKDPEVARCALDDAIESSTPSIAEDALYERANAAMEKMDLKEVLATVALCRAVPAAGSPAVARLADFIAGHVQLPLRHPDVAAEAFGRAAAIALAASDSRNAAWSYFWRSVARGRIYPNAEVHALEDLRNAQKYAPPQSQSLKAQIAMKLGTLLLRLRRFDEADAIAEKVPALAAMPINAGEKRNLWEFVGWLRFDEGRWQEAIDAYAKALEAGRATPLWVTWGLRARSAEALTHLGRYEEAFAEWKEAIDTVEKRKAATGTTVDDAPRYMADKLPIYNSYASALVTKGRIEDALKIVERGRSYTLTEAMGGRALPAAETPDGREIRLVARLDALNRTRLVTSDAKKAAAIERERAALRSELDLLRTQIAAAHPAEQAPPAWQDALALDAVLRDERTAVVEFAQLPDDTMAFVVRREGGRLRVAAARVAAKQSDLARSVTQLNASLAERDLGYRSKARKLAQVLFLPLQPHLRGVRRLIVVPDGVLWKVPFPVLPDRNGRPLIEQYVITYAPSLAMLRAAAALERDRRPAEHFLLALGNPHTSDALEKRVHGKYRNVAFGDIPDAAREVRELRQLYGAKATVFTGSAADEATAKRLAPSYRVLHFATHGIIDDAHAMYSALVLAPGANVGDDGLLEAREIAAMKLKADLAVLSACDTAEGEIYPGQGVIGISWAFLVAGCPTTVVTHWKASSAAARELMVSFHRHLRAGRSAAEALRLAELELRRKPRYAHPFYWANFLVTGLGR